MAKKSYGETTRETASNSLGPPSNQADSGRQKLPYPLLRKLPLLVTLSSCRFRTLFRGSLESPKSGDDSPLPTYLLFPTTFDLCWLPKFGHVCTCRSQPHYVSLSRASFISAEVVICLHGRSIHPLSVCLGRDGLRSKYHCPYSMSFAFGFSVSGILLSLQLYSFEASRADAPCNPCGDDQSPWSLAERHFDQ